MKTREQLEADWTDRDIEFMSEKDIRYEIASLLEKFGTQEGTERESLRLKRLDAALERITEARRGNQKRWLWQRLLKWS